MKKRVFLATTVLLCLILVGCIPPSTEFTTTQTQGTPADLALIPQKAGDEITPTDYSQSGSWFKLPENPIGDVDVFFLVPTVWQREEGQPYLSAIDNGTLLAGMQGSYERQATAFEPAGNLFMPVYRQLDANWLLTLPVEEQEPYIQGFPTPMWRRRLTTISKTTTMAVLSFWPATLRAAA